MSIGPLSTIPSFISDVGSTVTIDGSCPEAKKTTFYDGESAVQLQRAKTEESGYNWTDRDVKVVVLKNVIIYDESDLACLAWFISRNIRIDGARACVSPDALPLLRKVCIGMRAVEGSTIGTPLINGLSGMARTEEIQMLLKNAGFMTVGF